MMTTGILPRTAVSTSVTVESSSRNDEITSSVWVAHPASSRSRDTLRMDIALIMPRKPSASPKPPCTFRCVNDLAWSPAPAGSSRRLRCSISVIRLINKPMTIRISHSGVVQTWRVESTFMPQITSGKMIRVEAA